MLGLISNEDRKYFDFDNKLEVDEIPVLHFRMVWINNYHDTKRSWLPTGTVYQISTDLWYQDVMLPFDVKKQKLGPINVQCISNIKYECYKNRISHLIMKKLKH